MAAYPAKGVQAMSDKNAKIAHPGLEAGREGRYFYGWLNDLSGIAAETVLTNAAFLGELQSGRRYIVTMFYMHLSTVSDWVTTEFGTTVNSDGSGAFTPRTPKFRIDTGNVQSGRAPAFTHMDNLPIVLTAADGGAFTAQVQGNDAGATMTLGFNGYYEVIE